MKPLFATLAIAYVAFAAAPLGAAEHDDEETYVLGADVPRGSFVADFTPDVLERTGSVVVEVRYKDGLGSTRMGFNQFQGEAGGPDRRLEPGRFCTEWVGTFSQVLVDATDVENVNTSLVRVRNFVAASPANATGDRDEAGFVLDAYGSPGVLHGALLVCDDARADGLVRFNGNVMGKPLARADLAFVRITTEGSS